jgi:RNA polymerase sigma-70 factor (ECF subfamily)
MHDGPLTHPSLVLRLRNPRDEAAWQEFVEVYEPLVYRLVRRKGFQHADADELTQDVLLTVVQAVDRWEPDSRRGTFRGWLATIARRLMINFLYSPSRQFRGTGRSSVLEHLLQLPDGNPAQSQVFDLELKRGVFDWAARQVAEQVESSTWEAFWRTAVEAQPVEAVARDLGMSEGAVYIARSRVMRRLRITVERHEHAQGTGGGSHD